MKRVLSTIAALGLVLSLAACGGQGKEEENETTANPTQETTEAYVVEVPEALQPREMPVYKFDHTPTTDELRQMAVQAMRDELTVPFCVDRFYGYSKREQVGEKYFTYVPQNIYCGLPYNDAGMSLIQFYEYYDPTTGIMSFEGDTQKMDSLIGNSCAGSVCAALATVSASIRGFSTTEMTPHWGFALVGTYKLPVGISSFSAYPTSLVCQDNGADVMYESYAMMLPGDAMTSTEDNHAIMCIEPARVVYKRNGEIDPDKSIIVIQDQRGGVGAGYYSEKVDGVAYHYSGRTYHEYTFTELFSLCYVPITAPEFLGQKEYTVPSVAFDKPNVTLENVAQGNVISDYSIYIAKMILVDEAGQETLVDKTIINKFNAKVQGKVSFSLSSIMTHPNSLRFLELLEEGKTYTLRYDVVLANGETFTVVELPVNG